MREYKTLLSYAQDEIVIEKSRFIGYSFYVDNQDMAQEYIRQIRKKNYDATHNCYAYIIGEDMNVMKASDDGEPSQTAGVPILEVIKKENLTNTLIIATRYFGGIKLGAGGLVRAYTKTAKIAIDAGEIVLKKVFCNLELRIDYNQVGKIQKFIQSCDIISKPPIFTQDVVFLLYESYDKVEDLKKSIIDLTNGNCKIEQKQSSYVSFIGDDIRIDS